MAFDYICTVMSTCVKRRNFISEQLTYRYLVLNFHYRKTPPSFPSLPLIELITSVINAPQTPILAVDIIQCDVSLGESLSSFAFEIILMVYKLQSEFY